MKKLAIKRRMKLDLVPSGLAQDPSLYNEGIFNNLDPLFDEDSHFLLPPPEPILPQHTPHNVTYPLQPSQLPSQLPSQQRTIIPGEINFTETRSNKRRKTEGGPQLNSSPVPHRPAVMPQFNPNLTLELVGHYPLSSAGFPLVPVAHTVSVASILVRIKGKDPMLEQSPFCNEFIVLSRFLMNGKQTMIPGDGLSVSTFHMTKESNVNRNAFWTKETRIAKFNMKILFAPRKDEERRLQVEFQLCHQHGPGQFTAITSWIHLVDLYVCSATQRLKKSKKSLLNVH